MLARRESLGDGRAAPDKRSRLKGRGFVRLFGIVRKKDVPGLGLQQPEFPLLVEMEILGFRQPGFQRGEVANGFLLVSPPEFGHGEKRPCAGGRGGVRE